MKVILQRVNQASVTVADKVVGDIGRGLLLLVGFKEGDDDSKLWPMAEKLRNLRVFPDEAQRFHLSLLDISGEVLVVPQFTLYADTSKGRRPDFFSALKPELAEALFHAFSAELRRLGIKRVAEGVFGAHMQVRLENDGPVTIILEQ